MVTYDQPFVEVEHLEKLKLFWCAVKETARTRPLSTSAAFRTTVAPIDLAWIHLSDWHLYDAAAALNRR